MQKTNQAKNMDNTYLTEAELELRINELASVDILRLKRIANTYTGNHELDAEDLLQESICRVLSGDRKTCPRDLPIVTFVAGIIKSIAHGEREKFKRIAQFSETDQFADKGSESSPDKAILEKQVFDEFESLFEDDEKVLLLILYLQEETIPSEIQKKEGWTNTKYNSIRRRMRRKWNAHTEQELIS